MRIVILGAGFGGLELASRLSDAIGDELDCTLIDQGDAFVFGFAKLDLLFGKTSSEAIRIPYAGMAKPGVRFRQETIVSIDPEAKRVVTDLETYDADVLVVALGADYDTGATPGLDDAGNEFYSFDGAMRARDRLPTFTSGNAVVGVCGQTFKCPPAPSEAAILLDEYLRDRGVRDATTVTLVMPFGVPIPPSPDTSQALLGRFAELDIRFVAQHRVASLRPDGPHGRARRRRASSRAICSSRSPCTERPTWWRHRGSPSTAGSRWTTRRSRRGSPTCTPSATSRTSAPRRPACSPKARRGWSPIT